MGCTSVREVNLDPEGVSRSELGGRGGPKGTAAGCDTTTSPASPAMLFEFELLGSGSSTPLAGLTMPASNIPLSSFCIVP